MRRSGRAALLVLTSALSLGLSGLVARAEDPVADEAAFLAALGQAKLALAGGRAAEGQRLVEATLEQHRGKDYARAKLPEIEDLVRRLAFRAQCPPPDPKTLVKGDLRRFVSMTGDLEIRYRAGQPTDFETQGDLLVFPARFRGPFTITVRGDSYPTSPDEAPGAQVGAEQNAKTRRVQSWVVGFGIPPFEAGGQKRWVPARIIAIDGDDKKTIVEKPSTAKPGRPYRVDVQMTSTRVVGSIDGMPFGSAPKPDGLFGRAAVKAHAWSEIVVAGLVEPSWIQSKIDAVVDAKRGQFEAKFELRKLLPAWLYERSSAPAARPPPTVHVPSGLADVPPALLPEYTAAVASLHDGDARSALAAAESLRAKGAPDSVTGVLAAQALVAMDELTKALVEADRALAVVPGGLDALLVKAMILLRLGRDAELAVVLKAALANPAAGLDVAETAGILFLRTGRLDDARAVAEDAARKNQRSPRLEALGRAVVRVRNGPDWPKTHQVKTSNYDVVSDIDADICRRAGLVLEDALADFRAHVRPLKPEPRRLYSVFLFSGETGFKRHYTDLAILGSKAPEHVAGLYSPMLKQLLIWNLPNRDEMMRTIRHEGFHQYLDRLLADPPVWFNEGLATYFEPLPRPGSPSKLDQRRPELTEVLKVSTLVPSKEFLHITPQRFYATAPGSYAQAWLTVHLLRHGPVKHRLAYNALLARLETSSATEAVRAVFPEGACAALDEDLRAHLVEMSKAK